MLTRSQIQRIAQRNGVGMQVQERDYMQHLIPSRCAPPTTPPARAGRAGATARP
jgi:hypothetical protein